MTSFLCECKKTKWRLAFILIPVFGIISLWSLWLLHDPSEQMIHTGFTHMTTTIMLLNSMMLPISLAVMASRQMDMENKGNTYKLYYTLQKKSGLFVCKLLLAAAHLFLFFVGEAFMILVLCRICGVTEAFPVLAYLRLLGTGFFTCILLYILQLFFSMRLENQLYPLFIGLIGSFAGLFSMLFPVGSFFLRLCPWSYFTLGSSFLMVYDEATKTMSYPPIPFDTVGFFILLAATLILFLAVRNYFIRKEV